MAAPPYEFAVFGSTSLAALVAGLLAQDHHKRVCLIAEGHAAFRVRRGIDLGAMPATRPESLALLGQALPEFGRLLARLGAQGAMRQVDPIFVAETSATLDALSHMRHLALAMGQAVDRLPSLPGGGAGFGLHDIPMLDELALARPLSAWLSEVGVATIRPGDIPPAIKRDGTVRAGSAAHGIEAAAAVLADDDALADFIGAEGLDRLLSVRPATALLTEATAPLDAPVMLYPDRGVVLAQAANGSVAAMARGNVAQATASIAGVLAGRAPLRRLGQRGFRQVETADGAPLAGPVRGLKATVLAGFGMWGAFVAPALARWIAGEANEAEAAYFSAREAGRGNARAASIADLVPEMETQS